MELKKKWQTDRRAVLLARWIVRSVPLEIVGSSGQEKVLTRGKPGLERPGRPQEGTIMRQALVDPTVIRSTIRVDNISNCVYSGAKPDQCGMSQIGKRLCLVKNPGLFWGQMISVYGCGGTLGQFSIKIKLARSPDLSSVEHVWDQLKRQMPSCHSAHDLELAVQDLWAHLPQDNIRCLINSMPDRVAACIAAGGGPTRY
ncbi:transposable element Tcb2 transposase [Trichonephila clavipes]|uniref:Transposable element Tcb2 transposase n=1 Tax=Trichonephila clavipes TaxID=2585209 RepID=A0A8X6ST96_TRICX|nr:transposable element Tcb2 transposase [Trichonephila clavipes]